jgi:hypothetical protein
MSISLLFLGHALDCSIRDIHRVDYFAGHDFNVIAICLKKLQPIIYKA